MLNIYSLIFHAKNYQFSCLICVDSRFISFCVMQIVVKSRSFCDYMHITAHPRHSLTHWTVWCARLCVFDDESMFYALDLKAIYFIESVYRNKVIITIFLRKCNRDCYVCEKISATMLRANSMNRLYNLSFAWLIRNSLKRELSRVAWAGLAKFCPFWFENQWRTTIQCASSKDSTEKQLHEKAQSNRRVQAWTCTLNKC